MLPVRIVCSRVAVRLKADGTQVELRKPRLQISQLGYGEMHADTLFLARAAPADDRPGPAGSDSGERKSRRARTPGSRR